jgi:hypothetical protein
MPKVNLSGMSVEALMDLRLRVDQCFLPKLNGSWRGWIGHSPWLGT